MRAISCARFEVTTTIVLRKSTSPWRSLSRPASKDLEHEVEHIGMGFFNFIEEHDRIRNFTNLAREFTRLVGIDVAVR